MNKKKRIIISSAVISVAVAAVAATGITLAATLNDNNSNGYVNTGVLDYATRAEKLNVYSVAPASESDYDVKDASGNFYKYVESAHGAQLEINGKDITVTNFLPGDKVEFKVVVENKSTIAFNYRAELYVDTTTGKELFKELDFAADKGLTFRDTEETAKPNEQYALFASTGNDYVVSASDKTVQDVTFTVAFNIDAVKGQGQTVKFKYDMFFEQIENEPADKAEITVGDRTEPFKTFQEAIDYAQDNNVKEIIIKTNNANNWVKENNVTIGKPITFKGEVSENGAKPVIKDTVFTVKDTAAAAFEDIIFEGQSYIDVSESTSLTLTNCTINIDAIKFYDTRSRNFLSDAAFIVSGNTSLPVKLNLTENKFLSAKGAAICMRSVLEDGSQLIKNEFGTEKNVFSGSSVISFGGARNGATITLEENKFYGKLPMNFGGRDGVNYKVISTKNTAVGVEGGLFANGVKSVALLDDGSTLNGEKITVKNLGANLLFGGTDVKLDSSRRVTSGNFELYNINVGDFIPAYITAGTVAANVITVYEGGKPSYYINGTSADDIQNIK